MSETALFDRTVECRLWTGCIQWELTKLVEHLVGQTQPDLIWREPVNGPQPLENFHGLVSADFWTQEAKPPLVEARLYYGDGVIHLLAADPGARFAAWYEAGAQSPPPWLSRLGELGTPNAAQGAAADRSESLYRRERKVLLRTDANAVRHADATRRRGLGRAAVATPELSIVEYYDQGTLRWWRLSK